jgi:hypothetical protein
MRRHHGKPGRVSRYERTVLGDYYNYDRQVITYIQHYSGGYKVSLRGGKAHITNDYTTVLRSHYKNDVISHLALKDLHVRPVHKVVGQNVRVSTLVVGTAHTKRWAPPL